MLMLINQLLLKINHTCLWNRWKQDPSPSSLLFFITLVTDLSPGGIQFFGFLNYKIEGRRAHRSWWILVYLVSGWMIDRWMAFRPSSIFRQTAESTLWMYWRCGKAARIPYGIATRGTFWRIGFFFKIERRMRRCTCIVSIVCYSGNNFIIIFFPMKTLSCLMSYHIWRIATRAVLRRDVESTVKQENIEAPEKRLPDLHRCTPVE